MAQPTAYTPTNDFSDLETADPADGLATIGTKLDQEFSALNTTLDQTLTNLALIQRDDGELANTTVGVAQLKAETLALLGALSVWATNTQYTANSSVVVTGNAIYLCATTHTSGTFATDLAAAKWTLVADFADQAFCDTSTTSLAIAAGSKAFTVTAGKAFAAGQYLLAVSDAAPSTNYMFGQVASYSGTTLTVTVSVTGGSGTYADWTIYGNAGARGADGADGTVDITTLNAETSALDVDNDLLLVYDASESSGTNNKITFRNLCKSVTNLTAETAVDTADEFLVYDASAGTADKATLANVLKGLTTLTSVTAAATDELLIADVSDSNNAKKITVQGILDLVSGAAAINTLSAETAPAVDDLLDIWDTSEGAENSMTFANFFKVINSLTSDGSPDTGADYVVTYDASAGTAKKVLLSAFAGGVSASTTQAGVVELATAAEVQTGTDTGRVPSVSVLGSHQSAAKFWARVTYTSDTPALSDSYNVTSVTDTGVGDLRITIATDFGNANWCCVTSLTFTTGGSPAGATTATDIYVEAQAAGTVDIMCYGDDGDGTYTAKDPNAGSNGGIAAVGFGDQ